MTDLPLTGGCNCGAVRFEVTEPLVAASYCHCKRCQRRSGAAASPNAHPTPARSGSRPVRTNCVCGSRRTAARSGCRPDRLTGRPLMAQAALRRKAPANDGIQGRMSFLSLERAHPASQRNIASTFAADDGRPRREGHEDRPRFPGAAKHPRTERLDVGDRLLAERLPF